MKKIISLFQRDYEGTRLVYDSIVPGAEWVAAGEGVATVKWDGTCCMIRDGKFYKRYEVKRGGKPPDGFEAASDVDEITGKQQGWLPVGEGPEDRWHREAFMDLRERCRPEDGTYELCGPKVQGNPDGLLSHVLIQHGRDVIHPEPPRDFNGLREWFKGKSWDIEGIVWHHPDGRMVKIKAKDFGIKR